MNKFHTASSVALQCLLVAVVLLGEAVHGTSAVTCSPLELSPCIGAIIGSSQSPSAECCRKLREQKPCLCGYLKNPNLRSYVGSPNAKKVAAACGVPTPTC
ncbi:non-specific lipid-transfer protein 2-like [Primulina huaijiensis]|uniref:non-specific lipid-transfer protein 2-like n=1 Tax=Primulina huaijiensis TaxID=1492673 RepID=UPI003CC72DE1